jgi:hypothetical protein
MRFTIISGLSSCLFITQVNNLFAELSNIAKIELFDIADLYRNLSTKSLQILRSIVTFTTNQIKQNI